MACGIFVSSVKFSGQTCQVTFLDDSTNQTYILGEETIPFTFFPEDGTPQGVYFIYFSGTDTTYPLVVSGACPTPTPILTPTNTPTPTVTIGLTPTATETPTVTPTPSVTTGLSPTPTTTPTSTPGLSPTPTSTPGLSPTPTTTPTSTSLPYFAYLFIEPQSGSTLIGEYMYNLGSTFYGFTNNSAPDNDNTNPDLFNDDMNNYVSFSAWDNGTFPSVRTQTVPQSSGGVDSFGNSILAYNFTTHEVPINTINGNAWYTWIIPNDAINEGIEQKIAYSINGNPNALTTSIMDSTIYSSTFTYTGTTIPVGTYRVYTTFADLSFYMNNNFNTIYFKGDTVIPANTPTPTNTQTPTVTPTNTETPTVTPTNTETQTPTVTPTNTQTPTVTPTNTETLTPTNTETPTVTPTNTETLTPTNTVTPTNTETPTPTVTPTNTETPTNTPTPTSTPAVPVTTNLVLYYDPSNSSSYPGTGTTINDLSVNGLNGSMSGITFTTPYFSYNGTSSQVRVADSVLLEPGSGDWTMEVWVNQSVLGNDIVLAKVDNGGDVTDMSYSIRTTNTTYYAQLGSGSGTLSTLFVNSTNYVGTLNTWYQIVYVFTNVAANTLQTFVNGVSVGTVSHNLPSILNSTNPLYIGSYNGGEYSQWFDGKIGITRLYNDALTSSEVLQNFNADKSKYGL